MIEDAVRRGRELFDSELLCAESVLTAVAEERGVSCELIPRMATGFCSGLARTGGLCGAVSGAVLSLGMAAGRDKPGESYDPTYALVREVIDRFEAAYGSTTCAGLTGCDFATEVGQQQFRDQGQHEKCTDYVGEATRWVLEALASQVDSA